MSEATSVKLGQPLPKRADQRCDQIGLSDYLAGLCFVFLVLTYSRFVPLQFSPFGVLRFDAMTVCFSVACGVPSQRVSLDGICCQLVLIY